MSIRIYTGVNQDLPNSEVKIILYTYMYNHKTKGTYVRIHVHVCMYVYVNLYFSILQQINIAFEAV